MPLFPGDMNEGLNENTLFNIREHFILFCCFFYQDIRCQIIIDVKRVFKRVNIKRGKDERTEGVNHILDPNISFPTKRATYNNSDFARFDRLSNVYFVYEAC